MKDKYVMKYNGNKWELAMKEDLINRIYDDTKYYIEQNLDKFTEDLLPSRKKTLARWLETDENDANNESESLFVVVDDLSSSSLVCPFSESIKQKISYYN